jgi:hypothetical protein
MGERGGGESRFRLSATGSFGLENLRLPFRGLSEDGRPAEIHFEAATLALTASAVHPVALCKESTALPRLSLAIDHWRFSF